ncbi:MAG TPA: methylenetetrahydrofolate--tRNA-(uracil(54)-C(5))-methyltransferase (FADH(2)-oxidizing) TrmFO [Longimicrobiales bacterium]|nr:methylenetetrahydrofolate--tRNA-(uracil(54)-C(5))-methyltransferase (FADH(2)-oxidizing) TrmFO [Longimicrobiales bacterium]
MEVEVVGGGLAGCEAAWQLAQRGHDVTLTEMRPVRPTPAHQTDRLAELVCTNSLKSEDPSNAHGLLKREMRTLGSLLLTVADETSVAAGSALAVDRDAFSQRMSEAVGSHPRIRLVRREVTALPDGHAVMATGPLTSEALTSSIASFLGDDGLAFFDSIAPIVHVDSIDTSIAFYASRHGRNAGDGEPAGAGAGAGVEPDAGVGPDPAQAGDYLNCPLDREEYYALVEAVRTAEVYPGHDWENVPYFEGCLPIEVMVARGADTLRFGPMRPIGLIDPRTGRRPWAVLQLRREDRGGQMWNMVGFQTRMRTGEQRRVLRMIPGLAGAEFLRYGSIHRNTYLTFPARLAPYGAPQGRPDLIFAGQLTGVEGYTESAASGILAGINLDRVVRGAAAAVPPATTMIGALYRYLREADPKDFQPMNSNFGLLEPLPEHVRDKKRKRERMAERAAVALGTWMTGAGVEAVEVPVTAGVAS